MNTIPIINIGLAVLVICLCGMALKGNASSANQKTLYAILVLTIALAVLLAVVIFVRHPH